MMMEMKFTINIYTKILNTICSQYKRISKSVLIVKHVRFSGKRNNSNFTKVRLHKIWRTPFVYTTNMRLKVTNQ
jgi:hypothetical protein